MCKSCDELGITDPNIIIGVKDLLVKIEASKKRNEEFLMAQLNSGYIKP